MDDQSADTVIAADGWLKATRRILWFCAGAYVVLAVGFVPALMALDPEFQEQMPQWANILLWGLMFGLSLPMAALNVLAARGLANGRKWAWIGALVLAALYLSSICLPFGAVMFYGLLRRPIREAYGI